ncbi:MAG: phenylalanine--tRNA ligase subunit beta [Candidatus Pacebacteria bacterium]|nr:phenylalanine--tRNA ligase subunit beta [Candidatus Paceibacterota bacterium]
MLFSYNWLKDYTKLPKPAKLVELLVMHSFEVEEVLKISGDYLFEVDVLSNRAPDCFSHIGLAREIAAVSSKRFKAPKFNLKEKNKLKIEDFININVSDKNDCLRYSGRVLLNVKVGPSPKWVQKRLKICGLRPINNIVDIVNYVMLETGQPLHAFDFDKISGPKSGPKKIIVRRAEKGEKIISLDDEKYGLNENILVISDLEGPLAIAGIKGGKKAEIDKKTKNIVLEAANFNYQVVRRASRILKLKTDASWRFENRISPNLTESSINRAAYLIKSIAKGDVSWGIIDSYPKKALPVKVKFATDYLERLLGIEVPVRDIKDILSRLEFEVIDERAIGDNNSSIQLTVKVPDFRLDISIPEDLIEEIGRIYGYYKIQPVFPVSSLIPAKKNIDVFWEQMIKDILKESGFSEVYNYSFTGEEAKKFGYNKEEIIRILNPISDEHNYLRPSLIVNLLKNVSLNFRYFNEVKIFELGKIFKKTNSGLIEKKMICSLIASKEDNNDLFYQIKGVLDQFLNKLGISDIYYDEHQPTPDDSKISVWDIKRCAEVKSGSEELGFLGAVSSSILDSMKIKGSVFLFDIDFEKLLNLCSEEHEFRPISQYPAAVRDLSVLIPLKVKVEEVLNNIETAGGALIRDVDIFDIYEGEGIKEGKKSLAFHIVFQAEDRTLKSQEIDQILNRIIKSLQENPQWEVRK